MSVYDTLSRLLPPQWLSSAPADALPAAHACHYSVRTAPASSPEFLHAIAVHRLMCIANLLGLVLAITADALCATTVHRRQPDVLEVPPAQLLARVLQLRDLLPDVNLPDLVQRRPRILTQASLVANMNCCCHTTAGSQDDCT